MVRIYFDWNVFTSLKESNKDLLNLLREFKDYIQIPFTNIHVSELKKEIENKGKVEGEKDLEIIDELTGSHFLNWQDGITRPFLGSIKERFDENNEINNIYDLFSLDSIFKLLEEESSKSNSDVINPLDILQTFFKQTPHNIHIHETNKEVAKKLFPNYREDGTLWDLMNDFIPSMKKFLTDPEFYKSYRKLIKNQGFVLDSNLGNWSSDEVICICRIN